MILDRTNEKRDKKAKIDFCSFPLKKNFVTVMLDWEAQLRLWNTKCPLAASKRMRLESIFVQQLETFQNDFAVQDLETGYTLTYAQLNRYSLTIASELIKVHSSMNDRIPSRKHFVLVFLDISHLVPAAFLGILKSGCAVMPLETDTPIDRLRYVIKDASVSVVITMTKHMDLFHRGINSGVLPNSLFILDVEKLLSNESLIDAVLPKRTLSCYDPAYCIYTSGSTGQPVFIFIFNTLIISLYRKLL